MKTQSGNFKAHDGTSIYWKGWTPDNAPKAVVHVIHGYAEHIDRYGNVVGELLPAGYAVFGTDHRGHGKSEGKRGHVMSFQEFIDDEKQFQREVIRTKFPKLPCFVLGHSMGSLIAMNLVEQSAEGIRGLVLSGTGSRPGTNIPKILLAATRILSRLLPSIHVKSPLPPDFISRDPEVVKAYVEDPLVYNVITPRLAYEMNRYVVIGAENSGEIQIPVLIQLGSRDTAFSGQKELFEMVGAKDKTFKLYEGLKHEVYNELAQDRIKVLQDLRLWLDAHV
ncbi:MAG TPA: lysophospholipase [Smithellaceae bacterium]|jgi:alpha-beta hydrolase superfamily lysophospholipase|nr:lysophospholipase [Syntrophaceae bacterium]NMC90816.1 alpha/beta hydrolase [Smithella sp.]HNV56696.1 lysophospholipase [Smithellaceae bacterium]HNY96351.1 lysophospholipase [Smithellaceae bacterium]HOD63615.1 lysophospholipase [Smithellaceae bacterium]